jgi:Ca2+-binding RTX toxin-like protein
MSNYYDRRNVDDHWIGTKRGDVMSGNGGNDVIQGMAGDDRIYGGTGNDRLLGGDGKDQLNGNQGNDMVAGGIGADIVRGGTGTDELWGGNNLTAGGDSAADWFVFDYAADSRYGDGIDTIMDFHPEEGDVINIGATVEGYSYNQSYDWELVDPSQLTHMSQQMTLTYDPTTGYTTLNMYFGDQNADVDMTLLIAGEHTSDYGFAHLVG